MYDETLVQQSFPYLEWFKWLQKYTIRPKEFNRFTDKEENTQALATQVYQTTVFSPIKDQINNLLNLNEKVYKDEGLTKSSFNRIGMVPECPHPTKDSLHTIAVLYNVSDDPVETYIQNQLAFKTIKSYRYSGRPDELTWDKETLRSKRFDGSKPKKRPIRQPYFAILEMGRISIDCYPDKPNTLSSMFDEKTMVIGPEFQLILALFMKYWLHAIRDNMDRLFNKVIAPGISLKFSNNDRGPNDYTGLACPQYPSTELGHPQIFRKSQYIGGFGIISMTIPGWDHVNGKWIGR
jgi:hypothetical protein